MKINKISNIAVAMAIFAIAKSPITADALVVEPIYKLDGVAQGYEDKDVPMALKVKENADGLSVGTILYRNVYKDIDYYAPWAPPSIEGSVTDPNQGRYDNWGFWNMHANKQTAGITSTVFNDRLRLHSNAVVTKPNGASAGTLPRNTYINVWGVDGDVNNGKVFFEMTDFPSLDKSGTTGIMGSVPRNKVSFEGTGVNIMHAGWESSPNHWLRNFKRAGKYKDNARSSHRGVTAGEWKNPSYAPAPLSNLSGEWRYIGYNAFGDPLDNPYFPSDVQSYGGTDYLSGYTLRYTPWNKNDQQTGESSASEAYRVFTKGMSGRSLNFEYDVNQSYLKNSVVDRLYNEGDIKNKTNVKESLSLKTHPEKQSIILKAQRKGSVHYRVAFLPNELRDIYVKSIKVYDEGTGELVGHVEGDINGIKTGTGTYQPGRAYKAEVVLANGANRPLFKNSLQAHIGQNVGAGSIDKNMSYSKVTTGITSNIGNKGEMRATKGSTSVPFIYRFAIHPSETRPIDIYGFVGAGHTGVDNLRYNNDTIGIRLTKSPTPPIDDGCTILDNGNTKICGSGDIAPTYIELWDESGNVVYRADANGNVSIRSAIVPGRNYRIVYYARYSGQDVKEYKWIPTINDNPDTPQNEYVPGRWDNGVIKEYRVPLNYHIEKYSGGPRDKDISSSTSGNYFHSNGTTSLPMNNNGSTNIPMKNGTYMRFYSNPIMFQYPYLLTAFKITSNDSRINKNTGNDRLETILNDNFDIKINNVIAKPTHEYTNGKNNTVNYNVTYDAELITPGYVNSNDYQAYINTTISVNGKVINFKDQLVKGGSTNNGKISHIVENVPIPPSGAVNVMVNLNSDKASYETGNYDNNVGSTTANIIKVKNPDTGKSTDTVGTTDNSDNNNSNKGGNANNNCLTPRTKNTWTSTHRKFSWNSSVINYPKLNGTGNVSFNKYNKTYENLNEATETYSEEFKIDKILFKSKETTEDKRGINNDGWVNLLDSDESKYAEVKAGYGFELQIVTKYNTDALTKRTWTLSNNGSSGTTVNALNTKPNYGMKDIFLELPGTDGTGGSPATRKILSSSGYDGTTLGLTFSEDINPTNGNATWTYGIKPKDTVGVGEVPKIFIPEKAKDGDYKLKIYTPPVSGVGSVNKKEYSALCDRKEVTIKVKGSSTNDLNSHETQ